jgi:hypothetical protein
MENNDSPILGYYSDGNPIYPAEKGQIVTHAFILCRMCNASISPNRGPSLGAICLKCFDEIKDL